MAPEYLSGVLLGLALITPIGAQNLFIINQGIATGFPRVLVATTTASACDSLLILLGALGAGAVLRGTPAARDALLLFGVVFLVVLAIRSLRARQQPADVPQADRPGAIALRAAGVSLLNPHAIFDTVGVIGATIAAQQAGSRAGFALGAVSASIVWFLFLAAGASAIRARLTPTARLWIERVSGIVLLAFAGVLAWELIG